MKDILHTPGFIMLSNFPTTEHFLTRVKSLSEKRKEWSFQVEGANQTPIKTLAVKRYWKFSLIADMNCRHLNFIRPTLQAKPMIQKFYRRYIRRLLQMNTQIVVLPIKWVFCSTSERMTFNSIFQHTTTKHLRILFLLCYFNRKRKPAVSQKSSYLQGLFTHRHTHIHVCLSSTGRWELYS